MYSYSIVEDALASLQQVKPREMAAFRARLRHLRNIGVSRLPTPGRGQKIDYTPRQVFQFAVALKLQTLGLAPRIAAFGAAAAGKSFSELDQAMLGNYLVMDPEDEQFMVIDGASSFLTQMPAGAWVNCDLLCNELNEALQNAVARSS